MAAVRVPPSACSTSQSTQDRACADFFQINRRAHWREPMSRWISDERPSSLPFEMSRGLRVSVE
ncbi:MAG: hypothetical protein WDM76_14080 [Limisphaerales bacterium]